MSPTSTLMSWGSSSTLLLRRNLPTGVMRLSLPVVIFKPALSLRMERNLKIRNGLPSFPMRTCRKNTPPGEVTPTKTDTVSRSGLRIARPKSEQTMSKARLQAIVPAEGGVMRSKGCCAEVFSLSIKPFFPSVNPADIPSASCRHTAHPPPSAWSTAAG